MIPKRARLVGGRFDGDEGELLAQPPILYVTDCPGPESCEDIFESRNGPRCELNGVHWWASAERALAIDGQPPAAYRLDRREGDTAIYVYGGLLETPLLGDVERELVPAGAGGDPVTCGRALPGRVTVTRRGALRA